MPKTAVRRLLRWFRAHARNLPWRQTRDPYAIWVSEIMLQQTQVATVIPYFHRWMARLPDVRSLATASIEEVLRLWSGLGYYRRARHLHAAAGHLVHQQGGILPQSPEAWLKLPGIGRYTAGAICSIAFNLPTPLVDGNVARVIARLHALQAPSDSRSAQSRLWATAEGFVHTAASLPDPGDNNCSHLNQALMELGATVCIPLNPRCPDCPLQAFCHGYHRGCPEAFPPPKKRPRQVARHWAVLIHRRAGRYFVRQRPPDVINAGLWEFPTLEFPCDAPPRRGPQSRPKPADKVLFALHHSITRYRIGVEVRLASGKQPAGARQGRWLLLPEILDLPLTGLHRRIARRLATGTPSQ